jgi:hypothetical protein
MLWRNKFLVVSMSKIGMVVSYLTKVIELRGQWWRTKKGSKKESKKCKQETSSP